MPTEPASYTKSRIADAEKLVLGFKELNENELHVLRVVLTQIAKAALADYQKLTINACYQIENEL